MKTESMFMILFIMLCVVLYNSFSKKDYIIMDIFLLVSSTFFIMLFMLLSNFPFMWIFMFSMIYLGSFLFLLLFLFIIINLPMHIPNLSFVLILMMLVCFYSMNFSSIMLSCEPFSYCLYLFCFFIIMLSFLSIFNILNNF